MGRMKSMLSAHTLLIVVDRVLDYDGKFKASVRSEMSPQRGDLRNNSDFVLRTYLFGEFQSISLGM
jgi:hypothetical protein